MMPHQKISPSTSMLFKGDVRNEDDRQKKMTDVDKTGPIQHLDADEMSLVTADKTPNFEKYLHRGEYGSAPDRFNPTITPHNFKQAARAAAENGEIIFMNIGDSIGQVASDPCEMSVYPNAIVEMLERSNPGVTVRHINQAIGGTKWSDFTNPTYLAAGWQDVKVSESWQENCARKVPDIVMMHWLGNDIPNFNTADVVEAVSFWKKQTKIPDILIGITYRPSYLKDIDQSELLLPYHTKAWRNAFQASVGWLRLYCQANGIGYIDFDRYVASVRDGYDTEDVSLTMVLNKAGTSLPSYEEWLPLTANSSNEILWEMPDAPSANGTLANACTDISFIYDFDALPTEHEFILYSASPTSDIIRTKYDIGIKLIFNDPSGYVAYTYSDGTINPDITKMQTAIPVPQNISKDNPLRLSFEAVGARVRMRMFTPFVNDRSFTMNWQLAYYGTGLTVVSDQLLARPMHQSTYKFIVSGLNSINIKYHRLCVGDRSCPGPDVHRYIPTVSCYDLYSKIDQNVAMAGGSNAYHMNAMAVRDTQWRAVRDQDWRVPCLDTLVISKILSPKNESITWNAPATFSDWVELENWMKIARGFAIWGQKPLMSQPIITGPKPIDSWSQQIMEILVSYGLIKDGTT